MKYFVFAVLLLCAVGIYLSAIAQSDSDLLVTLTPFTPTATMTPTATNTPTITPTRPQPTLQPLPTPIFVPIKGCQHRTDGCIVYLPMIER